MPHLHFSLEPYPFINALLATVPCPYSSPVTYVQLAALLCFIAITTIAQSIIASREGENQAPSLPNSLVQSVLLWISSCETVGLAPLMALMKSFTWRGGSSSLSESTSVQDISMAPASPGEQGVSFSMPSDMTFWRCQLLWIAKGKELLERD